MANRWAILVLHLVSLVLLGFGWALNMLHIEISARFILELSLFNENRSVLGTLQTLWDSAHYWSFLLIFLFGIMVPVVKSVIIFFLLLAPLPGKKGFAFVNAISKWAMADVFAISIFVAFLGANAMENTHAELEPGFYCFSAYVLLGGITVLLLGKMLRGSGRVRT